MKCCDLKIILLKLRVGLVKKISNVLSQKHNLDPAFFKYGRLDREESVVILFGKQRQPKLDNVSTCARSTLVCTPEITLWSRSAHACQVDKMKKDYKPSGDW